MKPVRQFLHIVLKTRLYYSLRLRKDRKCREIELIFVFTFFKVFEKELSLYIGLDRINLLNFFIIQDLFHLFVYNEVRPFSASQYDCLVCSYVRL